MLDTFPWPQSPTKTQIDAVASAAVAVRQVRAAALQQIEGGLRALYRTLQLPGKNPLKDANESLRGVHTCNLRILRHARCKRVAREMADKESYGTDICGYRN